MNRPTQSQSDAFWAYRRAQRKQHPWMWELEDTKEYDRDQIAILIANERAERQRTLFPEPMDLVIDVEIPVDDAAITQRLLKEYHNAEPSERFGMMRIRQETPTEKIVRRDVFLTCPKT